MSGLRRLSKLNAADVAAVPSIDQTSGIFFTTYGHSYAAGNGGSASGWPQRANRSLGAGSFNQLGVAGATMTDAAFQISATYPSAGLVGLDCVINDADVTRSTCFVNSLQAFIDFAMNVGVSDATVVATAGTWTTAAMPGAKRGGNVYGLTSTLNDSFTVSWRGDRVTIMLVGRDDTPNGTAGATYSVQYGATTVATGTLSNQIKTSGSGRTIGHVPLRLSGYGPGYHTVTVKKTDANGSILGFDVAITPSVNPVTLAIFHDVPVPTKDAPTLATFNAMVDTEVASAWNAGLPIFVVDPTTSWVVNTDTSSDGLHPSDSGHTKYAAVFVAAVQTFIKNYRYGLNSKSYADTLVTPPAAVTGSDNFTRADNSATAGATSTGAVPWQVDTPSAIWGITSNHLTPQNSVAWSSVSIETGRADGTFQWTINSGTNVGLTFRISDYQHMLLIFGGSLWTGGNGAWTSIGSAPTFTAGDVIKVVTSGTSIQLYKNGTLTGTVTSSYNQTATRVGCNANSATTQALSALTYGP